MTNIIQLRNVLKNLSDEQLQQEMDTPSGEVPPFLVLTEQNRRTEMRKSYEAEQRRRGEGRTTVAEDVMGSSPINPQAKQGPSIQSGMPAYADGGMVGIGGPAAGLGATLPGPGYGAYRGRIEDMLSKMGQAQATNRATAIIEAGLGIAGGTSPHFATNVGQGGLGALKGYKAGQNAAMDRELGLLQAAANLSGKERSEQIQLMDMAQRERLAKEKMQLAAAKGYKPTQKDKQIATLMNRGWSRKDAEDVAYGVVEVKTDEGGNLVLVNKLTRDSRAIKLPDYAGTGETAPAPGPSVQADPSAPPVLAAPPPAAPTPETATAPATDPATAPAKARTLWELRDHAAGVIPFVKETISELSPSGTPLTNPAVAEARQMFRNAIGRFTKALATNPRFAEGERKQLRDELKVLPKVLDSKEALGGRMRAIDASLRRRLKHEIEAGNDQSMAKKDRLASRAKVRAIQELLEVMGVPQETELEAEMRRRGLIE